MHYSSLILLFAPLGVWSHARVFDPAPRIHSSDIVTACSQEWYDLVSFADGNDKGRGLGPAAAQMWTFPTTAGYVGDKADTCKWLLGRAALKKDIGAIHEFWPDQEITIKTIATAKHSMDAGNITIVDVDTGDVLAILLADLPTGFMTSTGEVNLPEDMPDFWRRTKITMPDAIEKCNTEKTCAIHWWWQGTGDQHYQNLIDFKYVEKPACGPTPPHGPDAGSISFSRGQNWQGDTFNASVTDYPMGACHTIPDSIKGQINSLQPAVGGCCQIFRDSSCSSPTDYFNITYPGTQDMFRGMEGGVYFRGQETSSWICRPMGSDPGACTYQF